jgi:tRNA pseudouridine55 synthase
LVGEVVQVPPQYSAVKVRGRRAYKLARQGIRMDLAPRRVRIYELSVLSLALPDVTLDITCSGGTYIRSLASDLGVRLETGAHLRSLRRLESGSFTVDAALPSGDLGRVPPREVLAQRLIPLGKCLPGLDSLRVDDVMAERLRRGDRPGWNELEDVQQEQLPSGGTLQVLNRGELVALLDPPGRRVEAGARVSIARVFH